LSATEIALSKNHSTPNFIFENFLKVSGGKDPASEYYNNLCMKAVNQCIGRAIRHQNDYAAMILLDKRYQAQHVRSALPSWIENNLTVCKDFGSGFAALRKVIIYFFIFIMVCAGFI